MITWDIEETYSAEGYDVICGVDEAGRGPLAGPVFAAAVILPRGLIIEGLDDSKRLNAAKREVLYHIIKQNALSYAVCHAEVYEIEAINILNASMLAMRRAIALLNRTPDLALVDGNIVRDFPIMAVPIKKGDARSPSIAAASILAKVERDRFCCEMDTIYPGYDFSQNKGYSTPKHRAAIVKNGPCPVHRKSFLRKTFGEQIKQFDIWQNW